MKSAVGISFVVCVITQRVHLILNGFRGDRGITEHTEPEGPDPNWKRRSDILAPCAHTTEPAQAPSRGELHFHARRREKGRAPSNSRRLSRDASHAPSGILDRARAERARRLGRRPPCRSECCREPRPRRRSRRRPPLRQHRRQSPPPCCRPRCFRLSASGHRSAVRTRRRRHERMPDGRSRIRQTSLLASTNKTGRSRPEDWATQREAITRIFATM
jgi:hypothetical protein